MLVRVRLDSVGPADWNDRPVALVGGGPSLTGFNLDRLRDRYRVVAINGSIFDIPWADAGFSLDRLAMRMWWERLRASSVPLWFAVPDCFLRNFNGLPAPSMRFVRRMPGSSFSDSPWWISCGGTSGYGALQLAALKGARSITLFGFDYGASPSGAWHHNERHYHFAPVQIPDKWTRFASAFNAAAPVLAGAGVKVLNASLNSTISVFPKCTPQQAIHDPDLRGL